MIRSLFICTLFTFFIALQQIIACSCLADDTFCTTLVRDNGYALDGFPDAKPALVVKGVKIEDYYFGMRFKILDVIRGEEERESITVWGDNGALCRQYVGGYGTSDTVILALHHTDFSGNVVIGDHPAGLEQEGDYHLSVCGVYSLLYENGKVIGQITKAEEQSLDFEEWKKLTCLDIVSGSDQVPPIQFDLYPNPTDAQLFVYTQFAKPNVLQINVYNAHLLGYCLWF
ncbi:MAG: hypothetical protein AAFO82_07870 [Bacteroidota bacterium]